MIGDEGAAALARFIARNERKFLYLEISRNCITEVGGLKILEAMRKNTRLSQLLIQFGNDISPNTARKIEKEVIANQNITSIVKESLLPGDKNFGILKIKDKGSSFLRCSIKSVT